ncbi:MAG TPA: hypothetical protein VHZ97_08725 [Pseudonocardiaceae bacterium]|jgi:hypothetical protein|nr:hypothetical protein [Pseudonocardiaceae bacterium]
MFALLRYLAADVLRSHRYFPPVFLYLLVAGIFDARGDAGSALNAYGASALVLYPLGAWLAVAVGNAEDDTQRHITATATGGWGRLITAVAILAAIGLIPLTLVSTIWPAITAAHHYGFVELAVGFAAQLACGLTGIAVGVLLGRPVLRKIGWSLLAIAAVVVITFQLGRIPPVGSMIGLLSNNPPTMAVAAATVLESLGIAIVLIVGVILGVSEVARRRG